MEEKRLFQVLDEMNVHDIENGTRLISLHPDLVSADKCKQGTRVTMGAHEGAALDILNGKLMPVLMLVDKEEYFKRNPKK